MDCATSSLAGRCGNDWTERPDSRGRHPGAIALRDSRRPRSRRSRHCRPQGGDGYRFRGRGLIQLTGRDEYEAFGRAIGKTAEEAAAFCETHEGAAWSGCWYLARNGCLPLADAWDIDAITRRVNGPAMEAASERLRYSDAMLNELRGAPAG